MKILPDHQNHEVSSELTQEVRGHQTQEVN